MKRRFAALILACMLLLTCSLPVLADTGANSVSSYSSITSDGACKVSVTVEFRLDEPIANISFPLPRDATDVKKDGSSVSTRKTANTTEVDLSDYIGNLVGTFVMRFEYTLPNVIKNVEGNLIMELPLLSGFAYPVEGLDFTVTLPGDITGLKPVYTSIYKQNEIASFMNSSINGNMISGRVNTRMEDHDGLTMTLDVPEAMFPSISTYHRTGNPEIIPMIICAVLALVYWIIFLRTIPVLPFDHKTVPEGVSAGEINCRLTLSGADLTMMVFTWAQLGYITIQLDDRGRVYLHKRMEMGNERSLFEVRVFKSLFGNRRVVDGTGSGYARLWLKTAAMVPGERSMLLSASGNTKIFRILACGIQVFCAICFAMNMTTLAVLQVLLSIFLSALGVFCAWKIQAGIYYFHLRSKLPLVIGLAAFLVWMVVGWLAGQILIALLCGLAQVLAGIGAAYGGRRSPIGRQSIGQILGLRRFLRSIPKEELQRLRSNDPEFFFNMAPYALAMGIGKRFAKNFSRKPMPPCPYLVTNIQGQLSAQDWMLIMEETARELDAMHLRMSLERWAVIRIR